MKPPYTSPSLSLAAHFAGGGKRNPRLLQKVLQNAIEALPVLLGDDGQGVGGLDGVGIAYADDRLGPHPVDDFVGPARVQNPAGHFQPGRGAVADQIDVCESDFLVEGRFGGARGVQIQRIPPGAEEERAAVAPGREDAPN
jgi:hypothetical protein